MNRLYKLLILSVILSLVVFKINIRAAEQENDDIASNDKIVVLTSTSAVIDMAMQPGTYAAGSSQSTKTNNYNFLKVPTQITKAGGFYFIVDCYNNQILYNNRVSLNINEWKVLTRDVELPHSIASDGNMYLVTDTERNRILVFKWEVSSFRLVQSFIGIGKRPHYIVYDSDTQSFLVWSSMTGEMYVFKTDLTTDTVCISQIRQLFELQNHYVRSFSIMGDKILFPSGTNSYMILADKDTLEVVERYPVTPDIAGMAYAVKIENYYYLTVACDLVANQNKATIIRTTDLKSLSTGVYETVYSQICNTTKGIPYYIDFFDEAFYMTQHNTSKSVVRFQVQNDAIVNTRMLF